MSCLLSSSLVRRTGSSYELLALPKEVIVKQAEKGGESFSRREMHTRAADFYASIRKPEEQWKTIEDFAPQFEEMYHCRQAALYDRAAGVLDKPDNEFLQRAGYSRRMLTERQMLVGMPMSNQSLAYNLGWMAVAHAVLGAPLDAMKCNEESLELFSKIGDRRNEGIMVGTLGVSYSNLGETEKSLKYYEDALQIHREVGNVVAEGRVLGNIGNAYANLGDRRKALEYYEDALIIHRKVGNKVTEGLVLGNIGSTYSYLGDMRKAFEYYEEALRIHREVGDRVGASRVLCNKGIDKFLQGEKEEGIQLVLEALEITRQIEDKMFEDYLLRTLEGLKNHDEGAP